MWNAILTFLHFLYFIHFFCNFFAYFLGSECCSFLLANEVIYNNVHTEMALVLVICIMVLMSERRGEAYRAECKAKDSGSTSRPVVPASTMAPSTDAFTRLDAVTSSHMRPDGATNMQSSESLVIRAWTTDITCQTAS